MRGTVWHKAFHHRRLRNPPARSIYLRLAHYFCSGFTDDVASTACGGRCTSHPEVRMVNRRDSLRRPNHLELRRGLAPEEV